MPGYTFDYVYTHRSQVKQINDHSAGLSQAYYEYNTSGNVTLRNVYTTPITVSNYSYDPSDRVTSVTHTLNGTTRTYTYGYYDNSYNRKYAKRGISPNSPEGNKGEVFDYDLADQAIVAKLNIVNPDTASPGNQTIFHDANGNRTTFSAYGVTDTYTINNLNQYTKRNNKNASYGPSGTMSGSPDSGASQLTCTYDAQNRLRTAGKDSTSMSFKYDGLNRQVSRTGNGVTTYSTWDGWNLVEEYTNNPLAIQARYLYGPTGLVKDLQNNRYYCQDGSGSTSHLLDSTGHVLEWYRYDLQGAPFFYNPNDTQRSPNQSGFNVRHLFTGQQWHQDIGLYDLRNRFYSPDLGRFLQPDPIGFAGDATNLYRYCGNNPVTKWDQFGLLDFRIDPSPSRSDSGDPWMKIEGMTPDDYFENTRNLPDSDSSEGPGVEVGVGPIPDSGGNPGPGGPPGGTGGPGGSGGLGGLGGVGGLAAGDGGPGGRTLGNSPAKIFLGKFLQSFNSQGDWKQTADALDAFAAFAVNLLFFGEGGVAWGVGRPVLSASTRVTFARGTIQSTVLRRPMTVFRYWGGESRIYGNYLATADTVSQISSPNAASIALALPEGNTAATLSRFTIPAGARVWTGGIAGGADTATQVYVLNPDVLIVGGL
jgi:RHS repeat-associated protein